MVKVTFTASVHNFDTEDEFHGFIDPKWSMWELYTEANDVRTYEFDTESEATAFIESEIGSADNFDGIDWYAADPQMNYDTGESWSYHARLELEDA